MISFYYIDYISMPLSRFRCHIVLVIFYIIERVLTIPCLFEFDVAVRRPTPNAESGVVSHSMHTAAGRALLFQRVLIFSILLKAVSARSTKC